MNSIIDDTRGQRDSVLGWLVFGAVGAGAMLSKTHGFGTIQPTPSFTEQITTNCDGGAACGMLPLAQIAGLCLLAVLVVGGFLRYRNGEGDSLADDTRAQTMGPPPGVLPVIITAVCVYVGMSMAESAGLAMLGQIAFGAVAFVICFATYAMVNYAATNRT